MMLQNLLIQLCSLNSDHLLQYILTYYKAPINIFIFIVTYKEFNFYYTELFNSQSAFLFFQKFCLLVLKKPTGINLTQHNFAFCLYYNSAYTLHNVLKLMHISLNVMEKFSLIFKA